MPKKQFRTKATPNQKSTLKNRTFETNLAQREALRILQVLLSEKGFVIFPVSYGYQEHGRDFMAAYKQEPNRFVLVRPQEHTSISVQPFLDPTLYRDVLEVLQMARRTYPMISWVDLPIQVKPQHRKLVSWETFVPIKVLKRERRLLLAPLPHKTLI